MTGKYKLLLTILGIGTMAVWSAAIFIFLTGNNSVRVDVHVSADSTLAKKEVLSLPEVGTQTGVKSFKKAEEKTLPATIAGLPNLDDSNKISIDVLLELISEEE